MLSHLYCKPPGAPAKVPDNLLEESPKRNSQSQLLWDLQMPVTDLGMSVKLQLSILHFDMCFPWWRGKPQVSCSEVTRLLACHCEGYLPPFCCSFTTRGCRHSTTINPGPSFGCVSQSCSSTSFICFFSICWHKISGSQGGRGRQSSVTTPSGKEEVTSTNYTTQTCARAKLFSLWINAKWPTFLHIIYYCEAVLSIWRLLYYTKWEIF